MSDRLFFVHRFIVEAMPLEVYHMCSRKQGSNPRTSHALRLLLASSLL